MLATRDVDIDTDEDDEPPTLVVPEGGGILRKQYSPLNAESSAGLLLNKQADKLYTEIKTNVMTPSFSRLLDSDSSLNSSTSSSTKDVPNTTAINSEKSDADVVHELVTTTKLKSGRSRPTESRKDLSS